MAIFASDPFVASFWHVFITQMGAVISSKQSNIHSLSSAHNEDKWSVRAARVIQEEGEKRSLVFHINAAQRSYLEVWESMQILDLAGSIAYTPEKSRWSTPNRAKV